MKNQDFIFLNNHAYRVAPRLLGCVLEYKVNNKVMHGIIVETEAYDQTDVASHSYNGQTPRSEIMFGPPGFLYVYFTYGMHYCCNIAVGPAGFGAAVLIRAVQPILGKSEMTKNRLGKTGIELANGPAKVCQAFGIDKSFNGHNLANHPLRLIVKEPVDSVYIKRSTRIGISRGRELMWRYYIKDNSYVSKNN